jgi:hypothetical protein
LIENFENPLTQITVRIKSELAHLAKFGAKCLADRVGVAVLAQINSDAVDAIILPETDEVLPAHEDNALIAGVIVKHPGDDELLNARRRRELQSIALVNAMAAREALRDEHALLTLEATQD